MTRAQQTLSTMFLIPTIIFVTTLVGLFAALLTQNMLDVVASAAVGSSVLVALYFYVKAQPDRKAKVKTTNSPRPTGRIIKS